MRIQYLVQSCCQIRTLLRGSTLKRKPRNMRNESIQAPVLGALSILVIIINSCVCLLVYSNKKLRTYTNGFVVSLAISDLLTGFTQFSIYLLRQKARLFFNITYALSFFGGVTTLCGVTWDRYISVMNPLKYNDIVPKYYKKVIATSWIFTILIALVPLTWVLDDGDVNLHLLVHKIYHFLSVGLGCIVPYIIIVWAQYRIYHEAKKCVREDTLRQTLCHKQKSLLRRIFVEAKISKVFILVTIMFFISWFPMVFYTFAYAVEEPQIVPEVWIYDITPSLIALRTLVNPFIYSLLKPDFVNALRTMFRLPIHRNRFPSFLQETYSTSIRKNSMDKQKLSRNNETNSSSLMLNKETAV